MKNEAPLLSIQDLHVAFTTSQGQLPILKGVDLQIYPGEALGIVGESGCGKSVTAQTILQLFGSSGKITHGEIWFDGELLNTKTPQQMQQIRGKEIGMVFQDSMTSLNPTMCIGNQIAEILRYHEGLSHKQARQRAITLLEEVGIAEPTHRYHSYPFQLSGGMRQRVMIAIALACRPKLLIADEPTTALDVTIQAQILALLQKAQRETGMALLLITHDLGVVAGVCDRVAVMLQGKIVEMSEVETLFASPEHPYSRSLLGARRGLIHA